jgi:hypothetical protein
MEFLLDSWEWITCGPELRVAGLCFVIGCLFYMIVHEWKITRNPNEGTVSRNSPLDNDKDK